MRACTLCVSNGTFVRASDDMYFMFYVHVRTFVVQRHSLLFCVCVLSFFLVGVRIHSTTSEQTQTHTHTRANAHKRAQTRFHGELSFPNIFLYIFYYCCWFCYRRCCCCSSFVCLFEWMILSVSVFIDDLVLHTRCYLVFTFTVRLFLHSHFMANTLPK